MNTFLEIVVLLCVCSYDRRREGEGGVRRCGDLNILTLTLIAINFLSELREVCS